MTKRHFTAESPTLFTRCHTFRRDDVCWRLERKGGHSHILADYHPNAQRALLHSGFAEQDLRDVLPTIRVPTVLLCGDKELRSPLSVAEEMRASILRSRLVIIPGVGHLVDMEAPERFNAEVLIFLHSVRP